MLSIIFFDSLSKSDSVMTTWSRSFFIQSIYRHVLFFFFSLLSITDNWALSLQNRHLKKNIKQERRETCSLTSTICRYVGMNKIFHSADDFRPRNLRRMEREETISHVLFLIYSLIHRTPGLVSQKNTKNKSEHKVASSSSKSGRIFTDRNFCAKRFLVSAVFLLRQQLQI